MRGLEVFVACAGLACAVSFAAGQVSFSDVSAAAGLSGATHQTSTNFNQVGARLHTMTGGGAVADFNNDGWQDIFLIGGGAAPDRLMINNGDGTFTDQAAAWGLASQHLGIGASATDYDGDGLMDIYVTSLGATSIFPSFGQHRLYRNTGSGFVNVAAAAGVDTSSAIMPDGFGSAWGDYDLDGDLDMYVAGWMKASDADRLFRNNGDGTFTDVSDAAGIVQNASRGFAPRFVDMDGDRYPELLIASDFGTSKYLANNGDGTFTDMTVASGTGLDGNGMGHTVGDYNNDGLFDWYVTSIHSLEPNLGDVPGTGNMLYMCVGTHAYAEVSNATGVNDGGWGWGVVSADFDLDGDEDLFEVNGWTYADLVGVFQWATDPCYVYENNGTGSFVEVGAAAGVGAPEQGRGAMRLDFDNDGDQDALVFQLNGPPVLYSSQAIENNPGATWLRVFLDTAGEATLPTAGIGSVVDIHAGGVMQRRVIDAGSSFLSTSELSAAFGLDGASTIDVLHVRWTDGRVTTLWDVDANQTITLGVDSGPACLGDLTTTGSASGVPDGVVDLSDFSMYLTLWSSGAARADVTATGSCDPGGAGDGVDLSDFSCYLTLWSAGCP